MTAPIAPRQEGLHCPFSFPCIKQNAIEIWFKLKLRIVFYLRFMELFVISDNLKNSNKLKHSLHIWNFKRVKHFSSYTCLICQTKAIFGVFTLFAGSTNVNKCTQNTIASIIKSTAFSTIVFVIHHVCGDYAKLWFSSICLVLTLHSYCFDVYMQLKRNIFVCVNF